ncbi:hypothetical protein [Actinokineospora spheciospongiae]|uniref:hypothetical protein n=1 Tax=Actinokineospora spheciospongiae TaxID=909613 RepID=UPI0015E866F1|nr:hypothetical protein [Actinokineospora spheciospongiae]
MVGRRLAVGATALVLVASAFVAVGVFGSATDDPADLPSATSVSSTRTREAASEEARNPGWQVVVDGQAQLTYELPPEWALAEDTESLESSNGVRLGHLADFGTYTCQGAEYGRAFSGSGVAEGVPADAAAELAAAIAADQYSDANQTARVTLSRATPVVRDGVRGSVVRADAETTTDSADACAGVRGTVVVVALATGVGTSVVVLGADTVPGEALGPDTVEAGDLRAITDSVRPRG